MPTPEDRIAGGGSPAVLDGSRSRDPEAAVLTYSRDFGDNSTSVGVSPQHIFAAEGVWPHELARAKERRHAIASWAASF
jgi:hypothetical protein